MKPKFYACYVLYFDETSYYDLMDMMTMDVIPYNIFKILLLR